MADDVHPLARERIEAEVAQGFRHPAILARMTAAPVRHEIRQMTAADVDVIAAVMARAFFDDPLQVWLFPDGASRLDTLQRMFALQIRYGSVPVGESYTDSTLACAAFWLPPGRWQPDDSAMDAMHPLTEIVGAAMDRLRATYQVMVSVHPVEPHFYLSGVGTDPPRQGLGLGSGVLAPVLARCDREDIPAYLESTKERNIRFYEHLDFHVTGTITPAPDGPTMWCMWRDPRPRSRVERASAPRSRRSPVCRLAPSRRCHARSPSTRPLTGPLNLVQMDGC